MKGGNMLELCMAESMVAFQEYLDKRMGLYAPQVVDIVFQSTGSCKTLQIILCPKKPEQTK